MIRRPPRSTLSSSSAASDVYKRQVEERREAEPLLQPDDPVLDLQRVAPDPEHQGEGGRPDDHVPGAPGRKASREALDERPERDEERDQNDRGREEVIPGIPTPVSREYLNACFGHELLFFPLESDSSRLADPGQHAPRVLNLPEKEIFP